MQTDFHLLYPPDYDRNKAVPMKDYKFIHALKVTGEWQTFHWKISSLQMSGY